MKKRNTYLKRFLTLVLVFILTITMMGESNNLTKVSAASYGEVITTINQAEYQGYGTGDMVQVKYPESIDPEDVSMQVTIFNVSNNYIYEIYIDDVRYPLSIPGGYANQKTLTIPLDSGDIDPGDSTRYKLTVDRMMYGTGGLISTGSTTLYPNIISNDDTPPLINGATAVHIINYDSPTTVATFKATLTASDNVDGDLTASIVVDSDLYTGNEASLGDRNVVFSVTDSSGNKTTVTVIFRTVDVTNPIINLLGGSTIRIEYGGTWSDPGYTASDNHDSSITVNVTGTVDDAILGNYVLDYNASDSSGNAATTQTRTVIIEDTTAPVQTLQGDSTIYVEFGDNFTDPGCTWTDTYDGSGNSVVTGSVNVGVLGTYTLKYNKTDSNGNIATEVTRTVVVRDTLAPTFTGETSYLFNTGNSKSLTEILAAITANDLYDGDLSSSITVVSENYTTHEADKGVYTVELSVQDSQGNTETMTLTIEVIDNEPPVFTTSENIYTLEYANTLTQEQLKQILGVS